MFTLNTQYFNTLLPLLLPMATNNQKTVNSEEEKFTEQEVMDKIHNVWRETQNSYKKFVVICDQCGELSRYGAPIWAEKNCEKHESYKKYAGHKASFVLDNSNLCTTADIIGTKANIQRNCDLERTVENTEYQRFFTLTESDIGKIALADEIAYRLNIKKPSEEFDHEFNEEVKLRSHAISRELRRREREDEVGVTSILFPVESSVPLTEDEAWEQRVNESEVQD